MAQTRPNQPRTSTVSALRQGVRAIVAGAAIALIAAAPAAADTWTVTAKTVTNYPANLGVHVVVTAPDGTVTRDERAGMNDGALTGDDPAGSRVHIDIDGWSGDAECRDKIHTTPVDLIAGQQVQATAPQFVPETTDTGVAAEEQRFVDLVNAERARLGRGPLTINPALSTVSDAQSTAHDVDRTLPAHSAYGCSSVAAQGAELGVRVDVGSEEVYHVGPDASADAAWDAFKNSPGHYASLTRSENTVIGVGQVGHIWTADLAEKAPTVYGPAPSLPRKSPSAWTWNTQTPNPAPSGDDETAALSLQRTATATAGKTIRVTGQAAANAAVTIAYQTKLGIKTMTATANADGDYAARVKATATGTLTATSCAQAAKRTLQVRAALARVKATRHGAKVTGRVLPGLKGRTVIVKLTKAGKTTTKRVKTTKTGTFTARLHAPKGHGKTRIKVTVPAAKGLYLTAATTITVR